MKRRTLLAATALGFLLAPITGRLASASVVTLTMIKDPNCGCCGQHADYLRAHGYVVDIRESETLGALRAELGVPESMVGCHVITAGDYVIEGHVPAGAIEKLLANRPPIKGISVPGMPMGSPGMDGERTEPLLVFEIAEGMPRVFFVEP